LFVVVMATHVILKTKASAARQGKSSEEGGLCNYAGHLCLLNQLEGYKFCIRHILEDINAPYRQCSFIYSKNGKRCPNAAPKIENKESYCSDHTRKILMARQRALRKRKPAESLESLLSDLKHYNEDNNKTPAEKGTGKDKKLGNISKVLDYASDSESDSEQPMIDQTWRNDVDSDADSLDSDLEDPLRHAGVYTVEEAALITRDKMVRLQSLYIQELKRLNHMLREKRRTYLHSIKHEKESLGSIHATARTNPDEERQYQKLKAMVRYHTRRGPELVLYKRACEMRQAVLKQGSSSKPLPHCVYHVGGTRCYNQPLPSTKYCLTHIMYDQRQVLYRPCASRHGPCPHIPIPGVDGDTCALHTKPGPIPHPVQEEEEVETKEEPEQELEPQDVGEDDETEIPDELLGDEAEEQIQATALALLESLASTSPFSEFLPLPPVPQDDLLATSQQSPDTDGEK